MNPCVSSIFLLFSSTPPVFPRIFPLEKSQGKGLYSQYERVEDLARTAQ